MFWLWKVLRKRSVEIYKIDKNIIDCMRQENYVRMLSKVLTREPYTTKWMIWILVATSTPPKPSSNFSTKIVDNENIKLPSWPPERNQHINQTLPHVIIQKGHCKNITKFSNMNFLMCPNSNFIKLDNYQNDQ